MAYFLVYLHGLFPSFHCSVALCPNYFGRFCGDDIVEMTYLPTVLGTLDLKCIPEGKDYDLQVDNRL